MVCVDNCKHWGCILKNNTCSGCGAVMCRFCMKEEGGQHVHGWKNITLVKESVVLESKLVPV